MKIIAIYLPQYHEIEENNEWWGKGHTEWTNLRKGKPLFEGHYQPRVPLNENYYDLSDPNVMVEQANIAKKYNVYGFCFYHYWFKGRKILQKPLENMLNTNKPDFPYCISWANHHWINRLNRKGRQMLLKQEYGDKKDWESHFEYLSNYFLDKRYIKVNNKPMLLIYDSRRIPKFMEMKKTWDEMAKACGLEGLYYVNTLKYDGDAKASIQYQFDAQMEYHPPFALHVAKNNIFSTNTVIKAWSLFCRDIIKKRMKIPYDYVWEKAIENTPPNGITTFLGGFVDWDTTPRWGESGRVYYGANPETFQNYLEKQIIRSKSMPGSDYIFITAWNEWSEGAYLEPDEKFEYAYLNAIREALVNTGCF